MASDRIRVLGALLALIVSASCGSPSTTFSSEASVRTTPLDTVSQYAERRFVGRSNASIDDTPGERIDLTLEGDTLRFAASCNEVRAPYEVIDGVLHLNDAQRWTTAVACSSEQDAAASRLGELLESRPTFTLTGDVLAIQSALGEIGLVDAAAPHPDDLPLIGSEWRVGLIVVDDTGGSMPVIEPAPVLHFGPYAVTLVFSCRTKQLEATIDLDNRTISWAPNSSYRGLRRTGPPTTLPIPIPPPATLPTVPPTTSTTSTTAPPSCDPTAPSDLEQRIMPTLAGVMTYDIDIDQLHLRTADLSGLDMTAPLPPLPS